MAYYDVLISAWNNPTQPPPGVTGTGLTAGMTTQQKLDAVNAWMVASAALPMIIPTYSIYNLIVRSEFNALTAAFQQSVRDIISMGTVDASPGTQARAQMIAIFPNGTQTFANLSTLAGKFDAPQVLWTTKNGYPPGNLSLYDAQAAGLV